MVAIHKQDPKNNHRISLVTTAGKILASLITSASTHSWTPTISTPRNFVFRHGRSAADLLLLQSASWNHSLDTEMKIFVVALSIAGVFGRVLHQSLTAKLRSLGVHGALSQLIQDYLHARTLRMVIRGDTSSQYPINASVRASPRAAYSGLFFGMSSSVTFSDSPQRPWRMLMTVPGLPPATDVTGRTQFVASTRRWRTSPPGVVAGRSLWHLTKSCYTHLQQASPLRPAHAGGTVGRKKTTTPGLLHQLCQQRGLEPALCLSHLTPAGCH